MGAIMGQKELEKLQEQQARLSERIRKEKAAINKQKRAKETKEKILIGAMVKAKVKNGEMTEEALMTELDKFLTKAVDRKIFDLPVNGEETTGKKTESEKDDGSMNFVSDNI